jgi:hypothetical protein
VAQDGEALPAEIGRRVEAEHLPLPVTAVDSEIVCAGEVSYFAIADRIKQRRAAI